MARERAASNGPARTEKGATADWPSWVPDETRIYLAHTEGGQTIRSLAKEADVHPSTILRQVRRVEMAREDPLLDSALRRLAQGGAQASRKDPIAERAMPILWHLIEEATILAVTLNLQKGLIARDAGGGEPVCVGVVDREFVEEMALRGWIACMTPEARVQRYRITAAGRALLRASKSEARRQGFAEAPVSFFDFADAPEGGDDPRLRHMRSTLAESPLAALARRRDDRGQPFLCADLLSAADRLRDDFEHSRQDRGGDRDWEEFLDRLPGMPVPLATPPDANKPTAEERLERALLHLGPGLADVALRCCCLLEGLEQVERRLGWSARSGKIVLRIALGRLHQHYLALGGREAALIG